MDEDNLELDLSLILNGLEKIREYTDALRNLAASVRQVRRAMDDAAKAQADFASVQARVNQSAGSGVATPPAPSRSPSSQSPATPRTANGLNAQFSAALERLDKARASGDSSAIEDATFDVRRTRTSLDRARAPRPPQMTRDMQALYSTRINLPGGAAPLLGKTLDAAIGPAATKGVLSGLAPLVRVLGPIGVAFTVAESAVRAFYEAAKHSAEVTNKITSEQATAGGSSAQVSMLGFLGGNASAAREFNDRITSDPDSMTAAARVGVRNLRGQYGNQNWTAQYIKSIENTAAISNKDQRDRIARILGIEQQVARWALLSKETQNRIKAQADLIGKMNNPESQRAAAEFDANQQLMNAALDSAKNSIGQSVMKEFTQTIITIADTANEVVAFVKRFSESTKGVRDAINLLPGGQIIKTILGQDSYLTPGRNAQRRAQAQADGTAPKSPMMSNTQALHANTEAMNRLNSSIGGGARTQESLSPIYGQKMHEAMISGSLRFGALG